LEEIVWLQTAFAPNHVHGNYQPAKLKTRLDKFVEKFNELYKGSTI
jgi:hypothetical protein